MIEFKNEEERLAAKEILTQGKGGEFWKLIVRALEESAESIQKKQDGDDLAELPPDRYKLENEIYKVKKKFLTILLETPDNIISWLGTPDNEREDFDAYDD